MQGCQAGGAMASLEATEAEVLKAIQEYPGKVDIAGLNGPTQTVISGDEDVVTAVMEQFEQAGNRVAKLEVSHAFHSPHMESMLEAYAKIAKTCAFQSPEIPIVSNVTGKLVEYPSTLRERFPKTRQNHWENKRNQHFQCPRLGLIPERSRCQQRASL